MTNDKQVEVWREDFERWFNGKTKNNGGVAYYVGAEGKYCFADIELAWQSWLAAKRYMPPIELPPYEKPELTARDAGYNLGISDSKLAITAAGYSYRVKP